MSELMNVKAGDAVLYRYMGGRFQRKIVEGVTPSGQIKVCGQRFRPSGRQIGGSTWHESYIDPFNQSILDRQDAEEKEAKMRRYCRDADWHTMDILLISKVYALIKVNP